MVPYVYESIKTHRTKPLWRAACVSDMKRVEQLSRAIDKLSCGKRGPFRVGDRTNNSAGNNSV